MLKVVNSLFKTYLSKYRKDIERHYDEPQRLQKEMLSRILKENSQTAIGREHDFQSILKQPEKFSTILPIRTYEDHLPYIERILQRESAVLFPGKPEWIATTSGTTGATKYLPLSQTAIRDIHMMGSWLSLAILYNKDEDIQVFSSKNLLVGGAHKGLHPTAGVPQGDISALLIHSIPRIMRPFYIPDVELATAVDYEEKIEKIAHIAAHETGMKVLGGVPTWNLPLYRRILEIHGGDNMLDVWPGARVFKHGGVNFAPYRKQFEELFPSDDFIFQEIYNATEGFFGVQDRDDLRTMLLLLNAGTYYEFVPWSDFQQGDTRSAMPLADVNTQNKYVMLITTLAGLYRYPMGDLIQFTETNPYRIRILGRTQEFINAFGEDLLRSEAESAVLEACQATGALVKDFTAAPVYIGLSEKGRHHWVVEFEKEPQDLEAFNLALDLALQDRNYNYKAKRYKDYAIGMHKLTVAPSGFFRKWLKSRGKLGGQHKVPRLSNDREILESVLSHLPKDK